MSLTRTSSRNQLKTDATSSHSEATVTAGGVVLLLERVVAEARGNAHDAPPEYRLTVLAATYNKPDFKSNNRGFTTNAR